MLFEDCEVAMEHFDENWTHCPTCFGCIWQEVDDDGVEKLVVEHESMARMWQ
jgi:hypothetical protein